MKTRHLHAFILLVLFLVLRPFAAAQSTTSLQSHITWLTDPAREGRKSGQVGASQAAAYITEHFQKIGFDTQTQEFDQGRRNVVARFGTSDNYILIGAHYDGLGKGFPGASDNAAAIAALIDIGQVLKAAKLPVSIVLVAFDGEEIGLLGSRYYAENPLFPLQSARAVVILDVLGRNFLDLPAPHLFVFGSEFSPGLAAALAKHKTSDMVVAGTDLIGTRSDYAPFAQHRVPYLFFTDGTHKDYHGTGDDDAHISVAWLEKEAVQISGVVSELAGEPSTIAFVSPPRYPSDEKSALLGLLRVTKEARSDFPIAFRLLLDDLTERISNDSSRESLRMTATVLLGFATPRLSIPILRGMVVPYYERQNRPDLVAAIKDAVTQLQSVP